MTYTAADLKNMSSRELITALWGDKVLTAIDSVDIIPMSIDEFLNHCITCGGDWGAMLLTGIKALYPAVYDVIPDNMGKYSWFALCEVLALLGVNTENA